MRAGGFSLGGEQSGHIVLPDLGTTGDGVLTGLRLMSPDGADRHDAGRTRRRDDTVPAGADEREVTDKAAVATAPAVRAAVAEAEAELGDAGRVLLRPSGTEPLVRVMVEAAEIEVARKLADDLAGHVASV